MEAFSIASAAVSLILGIYAIWLSIVFYRMSTDSSNRIQESAKDLSSSVNKLEKLFDHLYSDTFSMMRDTYSDMRRHVWPEVAEQDTEIDTEIEARADKKIDKIRDELMLQIESVAEQNGGMAAKVDQLREEITPLIDNAISRTRKAEVEARKETLHDVMLGIIRGEGKDGVRAGDLFNVIRKANEEWESKFFPELRRLRREGVIVYDGGKDGKFPDASARIFFVKDDPDKSGEAASRDTT